jgi:glucose-1-phosphate cytidylyltransferase
MKVVLFCGGLGTRLREHSETIPKPLVSLGYRPVLWHAMRYYAHFGHTDFVLCLGYRGDMIREYFLKYNECMSNDFTMSDGGRRIDLHSRDIDDWRITFVDTGLHTTIAERLLRARAYVANEPVFLANYADNLSDIPLDRMLAEHEAKGVVCSFAGVSSVSSLHAVQVSPDSYATHVGPWQNGGILVNGGYFVMRQDIFDYIEEGDELVQKPFQRLIARRQLAVYRHNGFWQAMDTFKDKITLDRMEARGDCPWMVWRR